MIFCVQSVLDETQLAEIARLKSALNFVDGKATAGESARLVKNNRQAEQSQPLEAVQKIVIEALAANATVRSYALPSRMSPPLISRYAGGEHYGLHIDEAIMGTADKPLRTDLSVTVFLTEPDAYEGGELEAHLASGSVAVKFAKGDAAIYPSTTLHRVRPVTSGERLVAVAWIQSLVRNGEQREVLYDLDRARRTVFEARGKTEVFDLLSKSYSNLQRMWADI